MENGNKGLFELNNELKEYSGDIFERLVEIILKKLYPEYNFTRTEYSHDGGKDFYAFDGETSIWAEAKCHKRHLELGRIAGTFIMAEVCKINRIIIFSLSGLTSGAVKNLTKFTSQKGKELIIFNDSDIRTLIFNFGTIEYEEILGSINEKYASDDDIADLIKDAGFDLIKSKLTSLKKNKECNKEKLNIYLTLYAYITFNKLAQDNVSKDKDSATVEITDKQYYLQTESNSETLKTQIKAFEIFTAELIVRNKDVLRGKTLKVSFDELTENYSAVTTAVFEGTLLPGQCVALTFYFKALNTSCTLALPQPCIFVENTPIACNMTHNDVSVIPCRVIGEVPYFGEDSKNLSQLNQNLEEKQVFATVLVHGKSGVGKSRFLYELQTARLRKGNRCFIFHGDNVNNSVVDFIRQLLYGYYNISFFGKENKVILPETLINLSDDLKIRENVKFINSCLNCNDAKEIDFNLARNWLNDVLKTDKTTLIVDNVQCLDKKVFDLLGKIIFDLKNCKCNGEIILAFNTELFISGSPADSFFKHLKCTVNDKYKICIKGFDEDSAVDFLKYSLDPLKQRNDLSELFKAVARRAKNNPLFLKQTVLYLHQLKIIGFQNDTICILNQIKLVEALNGLPDSVFDLIRARYGLLINHADGVKTQINDLLWSILIFGEFPENFAYKIHNFDINALNICLELGFIKHGAFGVLVFEHQLIAKSVLLLLESKTYNAHPAIVNIGLSAATAKNYLENIQSQVHSTALFAIEENYNGVSAKTFKSVLPELSLDNVTELFIPYVVELICRLIRRYNADIQPDLKTEALLLLIKNSQNKLGVQRTAHMFKDAMEFQVQNYRLNVTCADKFIELLKFYFYELPPSEKDGFLCKMEKIGQDLLSGPTDKTKKDDFEIWILWAFGKNAMHTYKFEDAEKILISAVNLAKSKNNKHRLAELEIQLGFLYSYLEDKKLTKLHWSEACFNFCDLNFYETVLNYVYNGNVALLNEDFSKSNEMCDELKKIYESKNSYDFLKSVTNDFISNSLILEFVANGKYSQDRINEIFNILERFRELTLMYDTNAYLHAAYKSLVFYNYVVENFKLYISEQDSKKYNKFIYIVAEELICNYDWKSKNFEFFYPVFKDIAFAVGKDNVWRDFFVNLIPQDRKELFLSLCIKSNPINAYAPKLRRGIFSDNADKVNLFHYTYRW